MAVATRLSRPLQRRCAQCRRIQDVRLSALYHVVVPNRGGGTRRDGGFDCRFCETANVIPANEMPPSLVLLLPSRAERDAKAAAPVVGASAALPEAVAAPVPSPAKPIVQKPAKRVPAPAWISGAKARTMLVAAFDRARRADDGHCTAFIRDRAGALSLIDAREHIGEDDILDWLDRTGCDLLVLGGLKDGARWKAIFHPVAGAATLAIEPQEG